MVGSDVVTLVSRLRTDVAAGSVACKVLVDMMCSMAVYWYASASFDIFLGGSLCKRLWNRC